MGHNLLPHQAWPVPAPVHPRVAPLQSPFWSFWQRLLEGKAKRSYVKSATIESSFLPLVGASGPIRGTYLITVTPGGLSSLPLGKPEE